MRKKNTLLVILSKTHNSSNYQWLNSAQKPFQNKIVRDKKFKLCFSSYIECTGKFFKK